MWETTTHCYAKKVLIFTVYGDAVEEWVDQSDIYKNWKFESKKRKFFNL